MDYLLISAWQVLLLIVVYGGWKLTHGALAYAYSEEYACLPRHRQTYVVKNTFKSLLLGCISILSLYTIPRVVVHGIYDTHVFRVFGCVYSASDIMGLIVMNRRLPRSTLLHHTCVVFFCATSMIMDYSNPDNEPFRQISMLGALSSLSWVVNLHLGMRLLVNKATELTMRRVSTLIYVPITATSICWQAHHIAAHFAFDAPTLLYTLAVLMIFYDDCVLISFLMREEYRRTHIVLSALLAVPSAINWFSGRPIVAAIEYAAMLLSVGNHIFDVPSLEIVSFFACVVAVSYGVVGNGHSAPVFAAKAYFLLFTVLLQIVAQGHKFFGHAIRSEDPNMFCAGAVLAASLFRIAAG
jgi:hypothetical protein